MARVDCSTRWMSIEAASAWLAERGVRASPTTLRVEVRGGRLRATMMRGRMRGWLVTQDELLRWLADWEEVPCCAC